jgi:hypothetical protein
VRQKRLCRSGLHVACVKSELASHVLKLSAHGQAPATKDALQLRNWAIRPEDAMLSLEEIACRILSQEENRHAKAAERRYPACPAMRRESL